jgi:hypothetical protein
VPLEPDRPVKSLRLGITGIRRGGTPLKVTLNECTLFDGTVDAAPWYRTFPLRTCPASALAQPYARILVHSPGWTADGDGRTRGVAVETVNLFEDDWPVEPRSDRQARAAVSLVERKREPHSEGTPLTIIVGNVGTSTWPSAADVPSTGAAAGLRLQWRQARPSGLTGAQRLELPRAVYPTDRLLIEVPMVAPEPLRAAGPWTVTITPVDHTGTAMPVETPLVVEVIAGP